MSDEKRKIGDLLLEMGVISKEDYKTAVRAQKGTKIRLGEQLVKQGACSENDIAMALSTQLGFPYLELRSYPIEPMALELVPERVAVKHMIVPLSIDQRSLSVAMADPLSVEAIEDLKFATGYDIKPFIGTRSAIQWAISHHYHLGSSLDSLVKDISTDKSVEVLQATKDTQAEAQDLRKKSEAAPIIQMVNIIISRAIEQNASDIHLEPTPKELLIRYRVDGVLRVGITLPKWVQGAIISRIKIMAKLDIAEKRLPQDGRIQVMVGVNPFDLRVSVLPANNGEKVVIRILDPRSALVHIRDLGFDETNFNRVLSLISRPQGILLVTGPTGSGKTTTLYACLSHIQSIEKNITTIEDPVEYDLKGINQVAINEKIGLTFAHTLRSILRQDPDVIMVGEMRDAETATIAMQASLTGHLVFSTVHTRSSVATITRLRQLGIPSYLIASTIIGITAQRLVRKICENCRVEDTLSEENVLKLGLTGESTENFKVYRGRGCVSCSGTGYSGRVGVHEVLVLGERLRELIAQEATEASIKEAALADEMKMLTQDGFEKLLSGVTSLEELLRVVYTNEDLPTYCSVCRKVLNPEYMACPNCGTKAIDTCPSCSRAINPGWNYCAHCSASIGRESELKLPA
jgi:type IV pilus assembly protein PilB